METEIQQEVLEHRENILKLGEELEMIHFLVMKIKGLGKSYQKTHASPLGKIVYGHHGKSQRNSH